MLLTTNHTLWMHLIINALRSFVSCGSFGVASRVKGKGLDWLGLACGLRRWRSHYFIVIVKCVCSFRKAYSTHCYLVNLSCLQRTLILNSVKTSFFPTFYLIHSQDCYDLDFIWSPCWQASLLSSWEKSCLFTQRKKKKNIKRKCIKRKNT